MVESRKQANEELSEVEQLRQQNTKLNKQIESMTAFLQSNNIDDVGELKSMKGRLEAKDARIAVLERLYRKVTTREAKKDALYEVTQQNEERLQSLEASLAPSVKMYNEFCQTELIQIDSWLQTKPRQRVTASQTRNSYKNTNFTQTSVNQIDRLSQTESNTVDGSAQVEATTNNDGWQVGPTVTKQRTQTEQSIASLQEKDCQTETSSAEIDVQVEISMCSTEVSAIASTTESFTQNETTYTETDTMAVPTMCDAETSVARVPHCDKYTHCMVPQTSSQTMTELATASVEVQCSLIVDPKTSVLLEQIGILRAQLEKLRDVCVIDVTAETRQIQDAIQDFLTNKLLDEEQQEITDLDSESPAIVQVDIPTPPSIATEETEKQPITLQESYEHVPSAMIKEEEIVIEEPNLFVPVKPTCAQGNISQPQKEVEEISDFFEVNVPSGILRPRKLNSAQARVPRINTKPPRVSSIQIPTKRSQSTQGGTSIFGLSTLDQCTATDDLSPQPLKTDRSSPSFDESGQHPYEVEALRIELQSLQILYEQQSNPDTSRLESQRDTLQTKVDLLHKLKAKSDLQIAQLQNELKCEKSISEQSRSDLAGQIVQLQEKVMDLQAGDGIDFDADETDFAELQLRVAQFDVERIQIQSESNKKEMKICELTEKLAKSVVLLDSLQQKLSKSKSEKQIQLNYKDEQLQKLQEYLRGARTDLSKMNELHRQSLSQIDDLKSQNEELHIKSYLLIEGKSKDEISIKQCQVDKRRLECSLDLLRQRNQIVESEARSLQGQLADLRHAQQTDASDLILEANSKLQRRENECVQLETQLLASACKVEECELTILEQDRSIQSLKRTISDLQGDYENMISKLQIKNQSKKQKASDLEAANLRIATRHDKTQSKMRELSESVKQLSSENRALSEAQQLGSAQKNELERQIDAFKDQTIEQMKNLESQHKLKLEEEEQKYESVENRATWLSEELRQALSQSSDATNMHSQEMESAAEKIANLDNKVQNLETELKKSADESEKDKISCQNLKNEVQRNQQEISSLKEEKQRREEALTDQVNTANDQMSNQKFQVSHLEDELRNTQLQFNESHLQCEQFKSSLQKNQHELGVLQAQIKNVTRDYESLSENFQDKEEEIKELKEHEVTTSSEFSVLQAQIKQVTGDYESLYANFQDKEEEITELKEHEATTSSYVETLEKSLELKDQDHSKALNSAKEANEEAEYLQSIISNQDLELQQLSTDVSESRKQNEEIKDELFILQTKMEQQSVLLKQKSEQIESTEQQLTQRELELDSLSKNSTRELNQRDQELEALKKQSQIVIDHHAVKLHNLTNAIDFKDHEIHELSEKLQRKHQKLNILRGDTSLQDQIDALNQTLLVNNGQCEALSIENSELQGYKTQLNVTQEALSDERQEKKNWHEKSCILEEKVASLANALDAEQSSRIDPEEFKRQQEENQDLRHRLKKFENDHESIGETHASELSSLAARHMLQISAATQRQKQKEEECELLRNHMSEMMEKYTVKGSLSASESESESEGEQEPTGWFTGIAQSLFLTESELGSKNKKKKKREFKN